jgi:hypothetical protein
MMTAKTKAEARQIAARQRSVRAADLRSHRNLVDEEATELFYEAVDAVGDGRLAEAKRIVACYLPLRAKAAWLDAEYARVAAL